MSATPTALRERMGTILVLHAEPHPNEPANHDAAGWMGPEVIRQEQTGRFVIAIRENFVHNDHVLVHELGHFFYCLEGDQSFIDCDDYAHNEGDYNPVCFRPGSVVGEFVKDFWPTLQACERNDFASDYARTNPIEDAAESFASFVFNDSGKSGSVANDKITFFYQFPTMIAARDRLRATLDLT